MHVVEAGAADHDIVAGLPAEVAAAVTAVDRVVALAAVEPVVAAASLHSVIAIKGAEQVVEVRTGELVVARKELRQDLVGAVGQYVHDRHVEILGLELDRAAFHFLEPRELSSDRQIDRRRVVEVANEPAHIASAEVHQYDVVSQDPGETGWEDVQKQIIHVRRQEGCELNRRRRLFTWKWINDRHDAHPP